MEIADVSAEFLTSFLLTGLDFSHPQVWVTLSRRLSYIWDPVLDRRLCVPRLAFLKYRNCLFTFLLCAVGEFRFLAPLLVSVDKRVTGSSG